MTEYIEREAFLADKKWLYCTDCDKRKGKKRGKMVTLYEIGEAPCKSCGIHDMLEEVEVYPAADVLPRDEAIKMGAELAAMHGSDATSQQLEEAYLKGVEEGMTRRDVRPVVVCAACEHNNHCLTQEFVDDCGKIPLDRNTFFCADGERKSNA